MISCRIQEFGLKFKSYALEEEKRIFSKFSNILIDELTTENSITVLTLQRPVEQQGTHKSDALFFQGCSSLVAFLCLLHFTSIKYRYINLEKRRKDY